MSSEAPRFWRLRKEFLRMEGAVCAHCHGVMFPRRDVCPHCHTVDVHIPWKSEGKGEVVSYTIQLQNPSGSPTEPKVIALIKLAEGPMVTAQLTDIDIDTLKEEEVIGKPVEMVTRKLGVSGEEDSGLIVYGYKFRLSQDMQEQALPVQHLKEIYSD